MWPSKPVVQRPRRRISWVAFAALLPAVAAMFVVRMDDPGLTQEIITFPSAIRLDHSESNTARAYVYRRGRLGERPVVVWVPGQYVIDLALIPI